MGVLNTGTDNTLKTLGEVILFSLEYYKTKLGQSC